MIIKNLCEKYLEKHEDSLTEFLKSIYLFKNFTENDIFKLREEITFSRREYAKEEPIVVEGQKGNSMFILQSGTVRIEINSAYNERLIIAKDIGPGAVFGEISLLEDVSRTASIIPQEPAVLLSISGKELNNLHKFPDISSKFYKNLSEKLSRNIIDTNEQIRTARDNLKKCYEEQKKLKEKIETLETKLDNYRLKNE